MPPGPSRRIDRLRWALALLVAPLLLFLPLLVRGEVFLPLLPVGLPPLAGEYPTEAAEALRDANPVVGDRLFPFLTDQLAIREELRQGNLPTWEPWLGLGLPLLGQSIVGALYPPNVLGVVLPPERAAAPLATLALVLAGSGLWLFLRRCGLDRRAALLGVVAQQLGTWGLANAALPMKLDAAVWFPWALWAVEGIVRQRKGSVVALALALGLSFLGGMVTIGAFVFAATALYALVRLEPLPFHFAPRSREGGLVPPLVAVVACALGAALAAVQLLPLAETAEHSLRDAASPEEIEAQGLPYTTLAGLVVPDLVGRPNESLPGENLPLAWWLTPSGDFRKAEHANVLEWNTHAGVFLVLLALTALFAVPKRAIFPAFLVVLVLAFAQGWPLVRLLYRVPGLDFGAPGRSLALAWTLWPWLAALGAQALLDRTPRALWSFLTTAFFLAAVGFSLWSTLDPPAWAADLHQTIVARYHEPFGITLADAEARLPPEVALEAGRHLRESYARLATAALAAFLAGCLGLVGDRNRARFERGSPPPLVLGGALVVLAVTVAPAWDQGAPAGSRGLQAGLALAALLALLPIVPWGQLRLGAMWLALLAGVLGEGFLGAKGHVEGRRVLTEAVFPPSDTIGAIAAAAGDGRVLRYDPTDTLGHSARLARPNMLAPYRVRDIAAYPTFTPRTHVELWNALDPRATLRNHVARLPDVAHLDHPLLDLLRARAVLSVEPLQHPNLEPVLEREGFHVYHRTGALPPARVVDRAIGATSDREVLDALTSRTADLEGTTWVAPEHAEVARGIEPGTTENTRITRVDQPLRNRVVVDVENASGGWLVLHEQWAPGWRAFVGDLELPLVRADHVHRAVPLPAEGDVTIVFRHAPASLAFGAWLAAGALAVAALLDLLVLRRGRRSLI